MRTHLIQESVGPAINLTPLIDMVFILLIFFAVTSSFVKEAGVEVERPTAQTGVQQTQANILIGVTRSGEVWIERQRIDIRLLRGHVERLHAENPEGAVVILADKASLTGTVIEVLDQVRLAGISNVSVATTEAEP